MKFNGKCVTVKWHKPLCSFCSEPIELPEHGYAGWYVEDDGQYRDPQLVHAGGNGCRYYHRFPHGHRGGFLNDVPVNWLRRVPMEAICIAMRRRASTEAERIVWHSWVSAVLGLPFSTEDSLFMITAQDRVGNYVAERVLTVREAASDIGEELP